MSLEEEYQKIQDELQTSFDSGVTLPYEYRIGQLKKCAAMIKAMEKVRLNQFRSLSNILLSLIYMQHQYDFASLTVFNRILKSLIGKRILNLRLFPLFVNVLLLIADVMTHACD